MKLKFGLAMTLAMVAVPVILVILARNDLGKERFYGSLETIGIVIVLIVLAIAAGTMGLFYVRLRGEATAKIETAKRTSNEVHHYHTERHTIDRGGTYHIAGGDPWQYPDQVRALLNSQQGGGGPPLLPPPNNYTAQLPAAPTSTTQPARLQDVAPVMREQPEWSPYSGMSDEF